ncbi:MAG: hypothetical protein H6539_05510 [Bacteroidales bacterium]|nr:hypothetical protein [Bacteroidales bacterium]
MKTRTKILLLFAGMIFLFSCDDPETVVTNIVHPDGSVTRTIVMKSTKKIPDPAQYQVPFDSTWTISKDTIPGEKDTSWVLTATKEFRSVSEINLEYKSDSGSNKVLNRTASFSKHFRWFTTIYRYSEKVDRMLNVTVKAEDVLDEEELKYFYMPASMLDSLQAGPDSLLYREKKNINDSLENIYLFTGLTEEWIHQYLMLNPDSTYILPMKDSLVKLAANSDFDGDSLLIRAFGNTYYETNKVFINQALNEVDSLMSIAMLAKFYTCETVMPFKLIATNGFADKSGKISWPVDSKYFISQDYEMWAESKKSNAWAWAVSGVFVVFVISGLTRRSKRKRQS